MKGTNNWSFKEVVQFLEINYFHCVHIEGSHHFYVGMIDGEETIVEVQYHASSYIKKGTLEKSIIKKSKIPAKFWKDYTKLPPQKRKKSIYEKSQPHPSTKNK